MQVTSIVALLIAATGALAAPGRQGKKPSNRITINQSNTCGNDNYPACCYGEANGKNGEVDIKCNKMDNSCNGFVTCCNNVAGGDGVQVCGGFSNIKGGVRITINTD